MNGELPPRRQPIGRYPTGDEQPAAGLAAPFRPILRMYQPPASAPSAPSALSAPSAPQE